jgi:transketolase
VVIATGSEVALAVEAARKAADHGHSVRVVSMPCAERFLKQDAAYQEQVLPRGVKRRLAVEAGVSQYWWRFVGSSGDVLGVDTFGESAPAPTLFEHFGFTVDNIVARIRGLFA